MLGENIKNLRKQKGYSQETLAEKLCVVRQTVSKWEQGISVPDAVMLKQISELFEVSVNDLLGSAVPAEDADISDVAKQLAVLNDYLANRSVKRRKTIKRVIIWGIVAIFALCSLYIAAFCILKSQRAANETRATAHLQCELNGETYLYGITYNDQFQILEAGGDAWIANHVQTEKYSDANILIAQIEDYFTDRGGTCIITYEKENVK